MILNCYSSPFLCTLSMSCFLCFFFVCFFCFLFSFVLFFFFFFFFFFSFLFFGFFFCCCCCFFVVFFLFCFFSFFFSVCCVCVFFFFFFISADRSEAISLRGSESSLGAYIRIWYSLKTTPWNSMLESTFFSGVPEMKAYFLSANAGKCILKYKKLLLSKTALFKYVNGF